MATVPSQNPASQNRGVGIFSTFQKAKEAIHELRSSGFNKHNTSIIAQEATQHPEVNVKHVGELSGLDIPEERAGAYSDRVAQGEYLVTVSGSEESIQRAEAILQKRGIQDWDVYLLSEHPEVIVVDRREKTL